ncbi:hypothetical protein [Chitinilyticum litopenaei]|uniref:hypothetical protein n=1 Tax=Chitinilyticum litopenaei TaxID=1121276 RepID=UPI0003FBC77D|nr:hypothetical protein [Chitinilyticum litopenaei]
MGDDERGNLRARIDNGRTQWFEWDHFNRLAAVRGNDVDTEFAYAAKQVPVG